MSERRTHVFVSYSHRDREWLERLHVHLRPLVREKALDVWDDRIIQPGSNWREEIQRSISKARVAILLVSADFLASDFITENELPPLLEKAEREGAKILPIIIGPCRFTETRVLSQFQAINDPTQPLLAQRRVQQEKVFVRLSKMIELALPDLEEHEVRNTDIPAAELISDAKYAESKPPIIKVVGVGGGGGNAVDHMARQGIDGVELIVLNSDIQALRRSRGHRFIQIGEMTTRGLGAGGVPEIGRQSALESTDRIIDDLEGAYLVFVAAGMGGGTGTGAAPIIGSLAKELGILTIAVVTKPFYFEGIKRRQYAEEGIEELQQCVDSLIVIPNDKVFAVVDSNETLLMAFRRVDEVLRWIVEGIAYLVVKPGLVNVDYADLKSVMNDKGYARMGTGVAVRANNGAEEAVLSALDNPLTELLEPKGQQSVLVNIVSGPDLLLSDVETVGRAIGSRFGEDALIIIGTALAEELKNEIRVTVVATGYEPEKRKPQWTQPAEQD